ncbi:MAG: alpha/beta hydrolase-fold protein [Planctomycetia bacterium]|nr:alpha/beta hydrolase-fold protein [Planctomycetia bacterium]
MFIISFLFICGASLHGKTQFAQKHAEFTKKEWLSATGEKLLYRQYSPSVKEGEKYPLIIFLHGAGERGNDNTSQLRHDEWMRFLFSEDAQPSYVIAPQCPKKMKWCNVSWGNQNTHTTPEVPSAPLRMVHELVQNMLKTYPIDENRVYITGISMGGYGTFDYLIRWGNEVAAAVPICGGADNAALKEAAPLHALPIWIFHGSADPVVPVSRSRNAATALKDNPKMKYTEMPEIAHDVWTPAYDHEELVKWLFLQQREVPSKQKENHK